MSEQNIPAAVEELDWQTKCDLMRDAIVHLTRIKDILDAIPHDYKPPDIDDIDDADCSDTKITLDKQVK